MNHQPFVPSLSSLTRERFGVSFKHAMDMARTRLLVAAAVFSFGILIIGGRLFELAVLRHGEEPSLAERDLTLGLRTGRADIVDRHGQMLATTITTSSLYANAKQVINAQEAAQRLLTVLPNLNLKETLRRLQSDRPFIWIARHLTPQQRHEVLRLGIPGLSFMRDQRRIYPHGSLAGHVLGYTDIDNRGIAGIEKGMDSVLGSQDEPLRLSLDLRLQHIVRDEVLKGMEEFGALGGCGAILDIRTGEVLAMTSLPDFDPNHPTNSTEEELFNKVTLGIYEVGSIMKVTNTVLALESGIATLATRFDATHPLKVGRFTVTDFKGKNTWLNVAEIFVYSSNVGAAKMALTVGAEKQRAFMKKLGYLEAPVFELPEVGAPLVPKRWREANTITISYGYGLSVSPLQVMLGIATMVGGGERKKPTLIFQPHMPPKGEQVITKENSRRILQLMRYVVKYGTSRKANIPGYYIFAKTGTANLREGKRYQTDRVMANFVGVLGTQIDDPRYVVYVMLEDPKRLQKTYGYNNAGWNAAPVGGRIIARIAPMVGCVPFEEETEPLDPFFRNVKF
ncbi:MAG: penicillin-binding protein 2 [Caedimonas sp.]|nr:penicillin-binding protein 2 [Caedimonas sp.]